MAKSVKTATPSTPPTTSKAEASTTAPATTSKKPESTVAAAGHDAGSIVSRLLKSYENTPQQLKILDVYLVFVMVTGIVQFAYVLAVGAFPYNAFLAGFIASVGSFVLTANLRIQSNPENAFSMTPERAFADFVFCNLLLFGFVINFIG